jgi:hypothetical protein
VDQAQNTSGAKDLQLSAWLASAGVFVGFAIYWWGQIQSVRELLEMAYG